MTSVSCNFDRAFDCEIASTALIAIDMQRDFLDPQGYCGVKYGDVSACASIIPQFKSVLQAARTAGLHVIHTREGYTPDGSDMAKMKQERNAAGSEGPLGRFLICGEPGQDIIEELYPEPGEPVFDKPGFSIFYKTGLQDHLQQHGITHLMMMGVTTQCCVHSSLRSAVDRGYWCLTVEDCCAALDPKLHQAAMSLIYGEEHLFGWVCQSADLVGALDPV